MEYITAKSIITPVNYSSKWFGVDYNMNIYRGCNHGCIYCDSRRDIYHINDFNKIKAKKDALFILKNELKHKKPGVIATGAMSDAYNPLEKEYKLTRKALELIYKYHYGIFINTKSNLVIRDIDILKEIENSIVAMTITTPYDSLSKIIEPNVCVSSKRFEAIKTLSKNNIFCGVLLLPVLPFITDKTEDIKELVKLSYENGAKFIYTTNMSVTLAQNQREYYYEKLDELFPTLKEKYMKTYGNKYFCSTRNSELYNIFRRECDKYGLLYKMKDIISAYKRNKSDKQATLFDW